METKNSLRQTVLARLKEVSPERRAAASAAVCATLRQQGIWQKARSVMLFAPMPEEPDIWPLVVDSLAAGKLAALPRFDSKSNQYSAARIRDITRDMNPGHFGIREPAEHCAAMELRRFDLVLVPGVAFDLRGGRLGRGKGYYDRILAHVRCTTCGVAFEEQIVAEVPVEPRDVRVNCVLTPSRWVEVSRND